MFSCMMVGEHCWEGWKGVCGTFTISLSSCSLLFYSLSPSLSLTVSFLWLCLPFLFHRNLFNRTPPSLLYLFFQTQRGFFSSWCHLRHKMLTRAHIHARSRVRLLVRLNSQPTSLNKARLLSLTDSPVTDCGILHPFVAHCLPSL